MTRLPSPSLFALVVATLTACGQVAPTSDASASGSSDGVTADVGLRGAGDAGFAGDVGWRDAGPPDARARDAGCPLCEGFAGDAGHLECPSHPTVRWPMFARSTVGGTVFWVGTSDPDVTLVYIVGYPQTDASQPEITCADLDHLPPDVSVIKISLAGPHATGQALSCGYRSVSLEGTLCGEGYGFSPSYGYATGVVTSVTPGAFIGLCIRGLIDVCGYGRSFGGSFVARWCPSPSVPTCR